MYLRFIVRIVGLDGVPFTGISVQVEKNGLLGVVGLSRGRDIGDEYVRTVIDTLQNNVSNVSQVSRCKMVSHNFFG